MLASALPADFNSLETGPGYFAITRWDVIGVIPWAWSGRPVRSNGVLVNRRKVGDRGRVGALAVERRIGGIYRRGEKKGQHEAPPI